MTDQPKGVGERTGWKIVEMIAEMIAVLIEEMIVGMIVVLTEETKEVAEAEEEVTDQFVIGVRGQVTFGGNADPGWQN
jgi:hypothetical protein